MIQTKFVAGWHNNITEKYVGESHGYTCEQTAVGTTNGAGPRNVQIFVLAADKTVIHALPGYWHPEDLASELTLALDLHAVWTDASLTRAQKDAIFTERQLDRAANPPAALRARSRWQGFDRKNEQKRLESGIERDTFLRDAEGQVLLDKQGEPAIKPVDQLVHERLAARPFVAYADFDVPVFFDYGRAYYDNNKKVDGDVGVTFMTPKRLEKRERELNRELTTALARADRERKRAMRDR